VTRIRRDIPIITELVHPSNISFLINNQTDYRLMKKYGYYHTEIYAMGETYISSVMDTLIAQAFYNPALIAVLDQVIVGNSASQSGGPEAEESSNLFPLRVPTTFVGRTFADLFHFLCEKKHIIPIGLYRYNTLTSTTKPYIVTNPPVDLVLTDRDMVFVLAKSMIDYESSLASPSLQQVGQSPRRRPRRRKNPHQKHHSQKNPQTHRSRPGHLRVRSQRLLRQTKRREQTHQRTQRKRQHS